MVIADFHLGDRRRYGNRRLPRGIRVQFGVTLSGFGDSFAELNSVLSRFRDCLLCALATLRESIRG
jgi:hypothetical protein